MTQTNQNQPFRVNVDELVGIGADPNRRFLLDATTEEIMAHVAELEWRSGNALPGDPDADIWQSAVFRRLQTELALRGMPRWGEAVLPNEAYPINPFGSASRWLALNMERRRWLATTKAGEQRTIVGPWRVIISPQPVDRELVVPARLVIIEGDDGGSRTLDEASRMALGELADLADDVEEFGGNAEALLGVSRAAIERAYQAACDERTVSAAA